MRPLRFAIFVACASAIVVALGRLWVRSLDQGSATPVERVLHAGTGAVGVAIAGANREIRAHRLTKTARTQIVGAALVGARTGVRAAEHVVAVHAAVATATATAPARTPSRPAPTTHHAPVQRPKPTATPKPKPRPAPRPAPKPAPTPAPTPTPTPAPTPTPTPAPTPDPTPPPTPEPTPAPLPPTTEAPPPATASDQDSRPGWGCGDKNHKHTGPPGHDGPGPC